MFLYSTGQFALRFSKILVAFATVLWTKLFSYGKTPLAAKKKKNAKRWGS
jgi:hypothetical protein